MSKPEILGIVAFFGITLPSGAILNLLFWKMLEQVNSRLPKEEQFDYLWLHIGKMMKLEELHKGFFPSSSLRLYARVAIVTSASSFIFIVYLLTRS